MADSAAIIAIGHHTADYIGAHLGRRAEVIHPPIYGNGPFPQFGSGDLVTMINPCAVKGVSIFLALADRFPRRRFAALPGWGTTAEDRRALEARSNITLLRNHKQIDDVLRDTRILLVPSLWFEGFGLIVVEAMLRGIPVVASDAGGLAEAKLGTRFVIPVRPIERYDAVFDDQGLPRAVLPEQDLVPWAEALEALAESGPLRAGVGRGARRCLEIRFGLCGPPGSRNFCSHSNRPGPPRIRKTRSHASRPRNGPCCSSACEPVLENRRRAICEFCWRKTRGTIRRMAAATNPTGC